jgi:hypothetical protein
MNVRRVIVLGLSGLLLGGCLACSDRKAVETPTNTIPLPKEGPVAAPVGPKPRSAGQPAVQPGPSQGKAAD